MGHVYFDTIWLTQLTQLHQVLQVLVRKTALYRGTLPEHWGPALGWMASAPRLASPRIGHSSPPVGAQYGHRPTQQKRQPTNRGRKTTPPDRSISSPRHAGPWPPTCAFDSSVGRAVDCRVGASSARRAGIHRSLVQIRLEGRLYFRRRCYARQRHRRFGLKLTAKTQNLTYSGTGNRTRATWVKARYPNH